MFIPVRAGLLNKSEIELLSFEVMYRGQCQLEPSFIFSSFWYGTVLQINPQSNKTALVNVEQEAIVGDSNFR